MTEAYKPVPEDIKRYRAIALAKEFAEEENQGGLEKAVTTVLTEGLGVKLEDDAKDLAGLIKPEFIDNFYGKYQKALQSTSLKDLRVLYDNFFKEYYTEENLAKADKIFDSDETYESFMKRYNAIAEKAKSKTSNFSDEEKKKAKEMIAELNKIALPLQEFEKLEIQKMKGPINKDLLKTALNDAYREDKKDLKNKK